MNMQIIILIATVLIFNAFALAENPDVYNAAIQNYHKALSSGNDGLVESALVNIMHVKKVYPQGDYKNILKQLEVMMIEIPQKSFRLQAYVVHTYIKHPERFSWLDKYQTQGGQAEFSVLTRRLAALPR
jgi:hypothetical protein